MAAYDAICQGDVASPGAFSSATELQQTGSYTPDQFRGPVAGGGGASMNYEPVIYDGSGKQLATDEQTLTKYLCAGPVDLMAIYKQSMDRGAVSTDKKLYVPCNECFNDHPRYSYCPYRRPCNICYKPHYPGHCPYTNLFPQGATFNRASYEIACDCGNDFNEDKWVCTSCGGSKAVLQAKYCSICKILNRHTSYECPKDRVRAAVYKSLRDESFRAAAEPKKKMTFEVYIPQRRKSYSSDEDDFP